jgi:cyclomaltodextrinase
VTEIVSPDWVKNAVFYQIYPDRFYKSPRTRHERGITFAPWGSPATRNTFQGGDLNGIVDKLDYLCDLGINALYLNPIFSAATDHRYNTYDYLKVDPLLGGDDALRELLDAAHARGVRVMLDGVFNHCGRGFWPFHHVLENGPSSPYVGWFHIEDWPLRAYDYGDDHTRANYRHWARFPAIPKLNTDNPGVRDYIFGVAKCWLEFGIDAWRLDVPYEIDDDSFWREFRQVVKSTNPDAYILGELWDPAPRWLQGDMWDALMNYPFGFPTLCFCGAKTLSDEYKTSHWTFEPMDAAAYARQIDDVQGQYDWQVNTVQFNLIDSHDTARALMIMGGDKSALRLAVLLQMTMPGAPCVYYGDEVGMSSWGDPHCRAAFPWHEKASWDHDLRRFYRQAIALRHEHRVLRTGSFKTVYAQGNVYAFYRALDEQESLVLIHTGDTPSSCQLDVSDLKADTFEQVWPRDGSRDYRATGDQLDVVLAPRDALVLIGKGTMDGG